MRTRLMAKTVRPKTRQQSSHTSDRLDGHLTEPSWLEAAGRHDADLGHPVSGPQGHNFERVAIYPERQRDLATGEQARVAESALQGPTQPFPFRNLIEASFQRPMTARAHTDAGATDACETLDANAFTSAGHVAFATTTPSLQLAAHEAAHVVQQQAGLTAFNGLGPSDGVLERHADQVADAVAAGRSASPLLGQYAMRGTNDAPRGAVQLKKKTRDDTIFVGGEKGSALQGPDDTEWVHPGEGGYALTMQGATTQFAGEFKELTESVRMKPVAPKVGKIDRAAAIATADRNWYKEQDSGWAPASTRQIWQDREKYADRKATEYTEDKRQQQANFRSYNAFIPIGNSLIQQLARIEAQKYMMGIKDDASMTAALTERMGEARTVGVRARKAYAKNKDDEKVEAPAATTSVEGAAQTVLIGTRELDASYLAFQAAVTLSQEAAAIKESGSEAQKRLDEINEIKTFLKNVAKTADFAQNLVKKAPEQIANYVEKPTSMLPSAEKAAELITDFVYYEEVHKLTTVLDMLNGMIEKKNLVKEFAQVSAVTKAYRTALMKFAQSTVALQRAMHDRREQYRNLGTELDRYAQEDPKLREQGLAPEKGGDKYATSMALAVELRQAVALARLAAAGMPPLEGAPAPDGKTKAPAADGKTKAAAWATWASGVINRRESYASYRPHPTPIEMPDDERKALEDVWSYLDLSDRACKETIKRFGSLDASAGELMAALGGKKSV